MLVQPSFDEAQVEITPGTYTTMIKKAEIKEYKSGDKYVNWTLETVREADPKNNGRFIYHKTALSGKGIFQLQKFYRAVTGQTLTGAFDTDQLLGKVVSVTVEDGMDRRQNPPTPTGYTEVKNVAPASLQ